MPMYSVAFPVDGLTSDQKREIAGAVTRIHAAVTGAPESFVHTSFEAFAAGDYFVGGEPAGPIVITGRIRAGRSDGDKQRILRQLAAAVADITGRPLAEVATIVRDVPSKYIFEGGQLMPEPGQEDAWLARLGGGPTTEELAVRHFEAWKKGDVEAIAADYAPDAVLVNGFGAITGREAIADFYRRVFTEWFPAEVREAIEFGRPLVDGDTAFLEWHGGPASYAADTLVIRDGRKQYQSFAAVFTS
ncbi:nuclear transport factor 2 family protein [Kitasatospora acidiphila]|uniref:nuclear transport factor 2 family protein n=1 Tax=Kitasatospora acidiphila TaxID=2567942 RepID=UPI003C720036